MSKLVFQLMTALNGRIDHPEAWVKGIPDDLYTEINRLYANFDVVLMGRTSYEEMVGYWPTAEGAEGDSPNNQIMAHKMNTVKKIVFSKGADQQLLAWHNAELALVHTDAEMINYINVLKAKTSGDIHLAGGAALAQSLVRLDLIDEYHIFVYPILSAGEAWFAQIVGNRDLTLISSATYANGVVGLYYQPNRA
jgi:dihydrofolate reductase